MLAAAEVLAGHALHYVESPAARGVLAGVLPGPRPVRSSAIPLPEGCDRVHILDAEDLLCADERSLRRVQGGKVLWELPGRYSYFFSDGRTILARNDQGSEVRWLADGVLRRSIPDMLVNEDGLAGDWVTGTRSTATFVSYWSMDTGGRQEMYPCGKMDQVGVALRYGSTDYAIICADGRVGSGSFPDVPTRWVQTADLASEKANISLTSLIPGEDAMLASGTRGWLARYDLKTGATLHIDLPDRSGVRALRWSGDGKLLVMHLDSGGVELRDAHSLAFLMRLPRQEVRAFGFGKGGELLVVVGNQLLRWTLPEQMIPAVFPAPSGLTSVAWSPDGRRLATSAGNAAMTLWSMVDGQGVREEFGSYMMKQVAWAGELPVGAMIRLNAANEVGESQRRESPFPVLL
ncbi:MAG TPA: WD40 repeat domain-containing protein, partial [Myxococcota bacterium]|nr:WD40 repeat domain-containing protein [Myxococcota bacterium]